MGTPASPVIRSFKSSLHDVAGKNEIDEDNRSALMKGGHQLVHSRVEAERKHGQNPLVGSDPQVRRDDAAAGDDIGVAQHHAFGFAGRARGVKDGGQVLTDGLIAPIRRSRGLRKGPRGDDAKVDVGCGSSSSLPASTTNSSAGIRGRSAATPESSVGLVISPFIPQSVAMWATCSGNNCALIGTKTPPALGDRENGEHLRDRRLQIDADPVAAAKPGILQPGGQPIYTVSNFPVGQPFLPVD